MVQPASRLIQPAAQRSTRRRPERTHSASTASSTATTKDQAKPHTS